MMLWSVRVRCVYGTKEKPKQAYMTALVEAKTSCDALEAGERHVEDKAPSDTLWLEFQAMQAAAVELPILTADI